MSKWPNLAIAGAIVVIASCVAFQQYTIHNLSEQLSELDQRTYVNPLSGPPKDALLTSRVEGLEREITSISKELISVRSSSSALRSQGVNQDTAIQSARRQAEAAQRASYNATMDVLDAEKAQITRKLYGHD